VKVALVISFFDSEKELPRCLETGDLYKHVDEIIGLDGRYTYFEADHDYSNDRSKEIVESYPHSRVIQYCGDQDKKRQIGLDTAGDLECDFMIAIDSDEYIHPDYQDWDKFYKKLDYYSNKFPFESVFTMKMFMDRAYSKAGNIVRANRFHQWIRIFKNPGNIKHVLGHHYIYCLKDQDETNPYYWFRSPLHLVDGVRMATDSKFRSPEYLKTRDKWAYENHLYENKRMARNVWDEMFAKAMATRVDKPE